MKTLGQMSPGQFNKPKGLKIEKEDQRLIGLMVNGLDGQQAQWLICLMVDSLNGQETRQLIGLMVERLDG